MLIAKRLSKYHGVVCGNAANSPSIDALCSSRAELEVRMEKWKEPGTSHSPRRDFLLLSLLISHLTEL